MPNKKNMLISFFVENTISHRFIAKHNIIFTEVKIIIVEEGGHSAEACSRM